MQEKLFELGIVWMYGEKNVRKDRYLLFINKKNTIAYCSDIEAWMEDVNKRIEPAEILAIQIKEEEKPKFDPTTLQPFDKVLVRNRLEDHWGCSFFSHINRTMKYKYICDERPMLYCIPFNEETKHLIGTPVEEPEFYKIWE